MERVIALDARFDHMQVSNLVLVEYLGDVAECGFRVAIEASTTRWERV